MKINNRRDILLLLLYSPGRSDNSNEPVLGRTRLVKMLFLFREELLDSFRQGVDVNKENFYEFFPWHYGPFSRQVYDDITFFELRGFLAVESTDDDPDPESIEEWSAWADSGEYVTTDEMSEYTEEKFYLTDKGIDFTKTLYGLLSQSQKKLLQEFKVRITNVPLRALLQYVYTKYPSSTDRSRIRETVLGHDAQ